jgi:uncharacterized protein (TIGR02001 family)
MAKSRTFALSAGAAILTLSLLGGPASAGGSVKDAPAGEPERKFAFSFNVGGTTDYVFRGVSQSSEDPAFQAGVDVTYGMFYVGAWGSRIDFDDAPPATVEVDLYAGIKPEWRGITFDLGAIYYSYPGADEDEAVPPTGELDYVELKLGASGSPVDKLTLGGTIFYSPDYTLETGPVWTFEGTAAYELRKIWVFIPTVSAVLGYQTGDADEGYSVDGISDDAYAYWNAGLALAVEKLTLDFRYWDTDIDTAGGSVCAAAELCDERFVFAAKITY